MIITFILLNHNMAQSVSAILVLEKPVRVIPSPKKNFFLNWISLAVSIHRYKEEATRKLCCGNNPFLLASPTCCPSRVHSVSFLPGIPRICFPSRKYGNIIFLLHRKNLFQPKPSSVIYLSSVSIIYLLLAGFQSCLPAPFRCFCQSKLVIVCWGSKEQTAHVSVSWSIPQGSKGIFGVRKSCLRHLKRETF